MTQLACAADPRFEASRIEEGSARSYTILTIEKLKALVVGPLSFLIGADAFQDIRSWYRWKDVVAAVEFIVVTRGVTRGVTRPGAEWETPPGAVVHSLTGLQLPESSSDIRGQLTRGDAAVPVPEAVLRYIRQRGLYGQMPAYHE
jgi:nicotinate-nucleotide adenylyltransferase